VTHPYPRDLVGYGAHRPNAAWPNGARVAVQFVLNVEEGGENCILHGDAGAETFLSEIIGAQPVVGLRHINMESHYEYGSRVGFWRILKLFAERQMPLTAFAVGMAIERNPAAAEALMAAGHEIATHGYRWIDYQYIGEDREREDMERAIEVQTRITGARPLGWYLGRCSPNTRRLVAEEGGFLYDSDSYADELPYYDRSTGRPQLIIPYSLETNDMRFVAAQGFNTGEHFLTYLTDSVEQLHAEGADTPAMLSIGLHARIVGRPGRAATLAKFLDYLAAKDGVWVCRRIEIARHWLATHPA